MEEIEIRAVELVRSIRDQLYEETKSLSPEELRAFIQREADKVTQAAPPGTHPGRRPAA